MADLIVLLIVALCVGAAIIYIIKEKKKGTVCIGCPHAGTCAKRQSGCGCSHTDSKNKSV